MKFTVRLSLLVLAVVVSSGFADRETRAKQTTIARPSPQSQPPPNPAPPLKRAVDFAIEHPVITRHVIHDYLWHKQQQDDDPPGNTTTTVYVPEYIPYAEPYPYSYPTPCPREPYPPDPPRRREDPTPDRTPERGGSSGPSHSVENPITSEVFGRWLKVGKVADGQVELTFPGDEYPVRSVSFFTEDEEGRRLNLETVESSPFTVSLSVDSLTSMVGVIARYVDGLEVTVRFPFIAPGASPGQSGAAKEPAVSRRLGRSYHFTGETFQLVGVDQPQ
ncbi:MAG: hypothetical protein HY318_05230 [Armatimonadetes bacterium]|nr:hypothetical protein [Armatimonadota bacterium]